VSELLLGGFVLATWLLSVRLAAPACLAIGARLSARLRHSSAAWAGLALLPIAVGTAVALSLISPASILGGCHCLSHPHHLHLCFDHVGFSWLLVVAACGAVCGLAPSFRALLRVLDDARATARWMRRVGGGLERAGGFTITSELGANAATVGLFAPRIVVGRPLWSRLDASSRAAVIEHERAHASRRDPLTLACLQLATCFMSARSGRGLVERWRLAAELECDRIAAHRLGDPLLLATALVECGRAQAAPQAAPPFGMTAASAGDDLDLRVRYLVHGSTVPAARSRGGDLWLVAVALAAAVLSATALGGASAHHAAETVLGWLT
jgi:Zn-dependent protease with chaperone function